MGLFDGIFGGGGKQTTQTTTAEPWKGSQSTLKFGLSEARRLYDKGIGGKIFEDSTVIPWDQLTRRGMNGLEALANNNNGGGGLSQQYQQIINNGGLTQGQEQSQNALSSFLRTNGLSNAQNAAMNMSLKDARNGGYNNAMTRAELEYRDAIKNNGYNGAMRDALSGYKDLAKNPFDANQNAALANTRDLANSSFSINNPAFQQVLQQSTDAARNSVNASASGAGRYGSGVHQQTLANTIGDLTNRAVGAEYNNWQNRRDQANQNLFQMGQTGQNTIMGANGAIGSLGQTAMGNVQNNANALGSLGQAAIGNRTNSLGNAANIGQSGITNRQNAAGALFGMGQQAQGNLASAYQGAQMPAQTLMNLGNMNEDLATRKMNDRLRRFDARNSVPWENLSRLNAIASGAGQLGSTQTQASPGQNPFLTALGYASGAGSLAGLFG